jgi:hypothetical protein
MFDKSKNLAFRLVLGLALVVATSVSVGLGARAAVHRIAHSIEKGHLAPKFSRVALIRRQRQVSRCGCAARSAARRCARAHAGGRL